MNLTPPRWTPPGHHPSCLGPLVWFDAPEGRAVLECARCDYIVVDGTLNDQAHCCTPVIRSSS